VLAVLVKTHGVGAAMAAGALSGLIMTLIGALRVGRFFSYLPQPVVAAFTSGLGVIIVSTQTKAVFGVEPAPAGFDLGVVDDFWAVIKACGRSDFLTLFVAVLVIGLMFILPRWKKGVPAPLVAIGAGALVALLVFVKRAAVGTVQGAVATWRPREAHAQEATKSLPLPVPYRTPATKLEPIVPDPANKEPSAIDPLLGGLYQSPLSRFSGRERLRSQWRRSTSNSLQAPEENNHDQSTTLRST
jgi:sulfate permease family protein